MGDYKVDLRHSVGRRNGTLSDRVRTEDPVEALQAFRKLLEREDLVGQEIAARLVVDGQSIYFSRFDKPLGEGRIHPDAPLDLAVNGDQAKQLAGWRPQ